MAEKETNGTDAPTLGVRCKVWGLRALPWWPLPFLAVLSSFMLWVRMIPFQAYTGGDRVYYIGTDPYYHHRATLGILESFPRIPRYDPYTNYPTGNMMGQFSTLYDWVAALGIRLLYGADATEAEIGRFLVAYPAVLGALIVIPFFFLARRLMGTPGAIVASIALALLPGEFLVRSLAGYNDHHVAEALLAVCTLLGFVVAVDRAVAQSEALARWRDVKGYRRSIVAAAVGGAVLALFFFVWPPALLFLAILALWLTVMMLVEHGRGGDTRPYAFAGSVGFGVAGLILIPFVETGSLSSFNLYSPLHVLACAGAAGWLWALHHGGRVAKARGLPAWGLPAAVALAALVAPLVLRVVLPDVHRGVMSGLSWVTGIGVSTGVTTIAEAQPADFFFCGGTPRCMTDSFGPLAVIAIFIVALVAVFAVWLRRRQDILLLLWSLLMFRATATQVRFSYYLALNLALLVGWLAAQAVWFVLELRPETEAAPKTRQQRKKRQGRKAARAPRPIPRPVLITAVCAVTLLLVVPGNVYALDRAVPGWERAERFGPDGELRAWLDASEWMRGATPDPGIHFGAIVDPPARGEPFDYGEEGYGVLSWWDYGHYLQAWGHRIPVANPFQAGAQFASMYFTERDPEAAEVWLEGRAAGQGPIRYVMVDDAMATGKYWAINEWANDRDPERPRYDLRPGRIVETGFGEMSIYRDIGSGQDVPLPTMGPTYRESMLARLYYGDASGLGEYRLVWEHPAMQLIASLATERGQIAANCFHAVLPSASCPVSTSELGEGLALGRMGTGNAVLTPLGVYAYDVQQHSRLKVFERVAGAVLEGEAQPGSNVTAEVEVEVLRGDNVVRSFIHSVSGTAGDDGRFALRFPYPTTDLVGPEGGGTAAQTRTAGAVVVQVEATGASAEVEVGGRAVLEGLPVAVVFP